MLVPFGTAQRASALVPNGAPDIVLPADDATDEDSPYNFVGDAITLTDPDAGTDDVRLDLSVSSGVLHVAVPDGLTFVDGTSNDSETLAMTGSLAAFDAALDTHQFMPAQDDTETVTLSALADDLGHNGDDGSQTDSDTMDITVNPVNDAPVVTVPSTQEIDEDSTATFSAATLNPITIADVDAGTADVQVTVAGSLGTATVATTSGLSFSDGDGTDDATMTFTSTLADANAALDGLTFAPDPDFEDTTGPGTASLTVTADDLGSTGSGGALSDEGVVSFTVDAVNDAPVVTVPGTQSIDEDGTATFSAAALDAITVSDVDAGTAPMQVSLHGTFGTASLATTSGLTFSAGDGTGDASMTFTATLAAANTALDGLAFTPDPNFNDDSGTATLDVAADDQGSSGAGGALSDDQLVSFAVAPVNDAPVNAVPSGVGTTTGVLAVLSVANGKAISVQDVDSAGSQIEVALTATHGTLTLASSSGVTITGGADGTGSVTFHATTANANAALDGLTFAPASGFTGQADITVTTDDLGNTGAGGPLTDTDTFPVTVTDITPKLALGATSVAVSSTGRVVVPVSCATAQCSGTLALRSGGTVLGSGGFNLAAGGSGSVAIDLTAAGQALVSGRASVDVTAVVTMANSATRASVLTLTAARAPSVKLLTGKAHVRAGKAKVKLSCGADGPCSAGYVLTATIGGKVVTVAKAHVTLQSGATKTLKLKLSKAAKKALRKGAVVATQTVTSDVQVGLDTTTTQALKLVV
jgi:hypothetical protein